MLRLAEGRRESARNVRDGGQQHRDGERRGERHHCARLGRRLAIAEVVEAIIAIANTSIATRALRLIPFIDGALLVADVGAGSPHLLVTG